MPPTARISAPTKNSSTTAKYEHEIQQLTQFSSDESNTYYHYYYYYYYGIESTKRKEELKQESGGCR